MNPEINDKIACLVNSKMWGILWECASAAPPRRRSASSYLQTSNIGHRTSDIGHRTSDIGHRTSEIGQRTSDIGHRTSMKLTEIETNTKAPKSRRKEHLTLVVPSYQPFSF